jgi:PAS domain S-box-containing protein
VVSPPDPALAGAIVASSPLATIVLDETRTVIGFNPAAERLTGRPAATVVGRPAGELFPAADAATSLELIGAAARGETGHLETELRTADDGRVAVGISWAPLVHAGRARGLVGVGRDIGHRKRLEHELRQVAQSFRALAEDSDLGMYRFSFVPDLQVDYVNPCLAELLGVSFAELVDDPRPLWQQLDPEARAALDAARRGEVTAWPVDATWTRADGQQRDLQVREVSLRDVHGWLEATVGLVTDVTGQRHQELAIASALDLERAAASRLRRVDELRKVFLRAVSHELRTPLTAVLGFSATLRDRVEDLPPDRVAMLADRVHRQATRMQLLLDDLLDVDRLSRGALATDRVEVDLGALVTRVAAEAGGDVEVIAPTCLLAVDPFKLERVLSNLLDNARRHAGPDAHVRVTLRPGDPVLLVVEDDGPGIPEDQRRSVFEPFAQGSDAEGAPSPGTGIGLTLVAAFTELHGGRASVGASDLGGARFVVELPHG